MTKTLVILLAETRAYELTYDSIKKNLIDTLNADLCLCIGEKSDYNSIIDPFYKLAKYKFIYNESNTFLSTTEYAFDYAFNNIITISKQSNIFNMIKEILINAVKNTDNKLPAATGILLFFRWYLLKCLIDNNLIEEYDRFIITRSDFIYRLPHPSMDILKEDYIWFPDSEHYGGYTDRHVVLSKNNIISYLNIFNNLITNPYNYLMFMYQKPDWNIEQLIKFHLEQENALYLIKEFPYIMYSVRAKDGVTRWLFSGTFSEKLGYYIKYQSEYKKSQYYAELYNKTSNNIHNFYSSLIKY